MHRKGGETIDLIAITNLPLQGAEPSADVAVGHGPKETGFAELLAAALDSERSEGKLPEAEPPKGKENRSELEQIHYGLPVEALFPPPIAMPMEAHGESGEQAVAHAEKVALADQMHPPVGTELAESGVESAAILDAMGDQSKPEPGLADAQDPTMTAKPQFKESPPPQKDTPLLGERLELPVHRFGFTRVRPGTTQGSTVPPQGQLEEDALGEAIHLEAAPAKPRQAPRGGPDHAEPAVQERGLAEAIHGQATEGVPSHEAQGEHVPESGVAQELVTVDEASSRHLSLDRDVHGQVLQRWSPTDAPGPTQDELEAAQGAEVTEPFGEAGPWGAVEDSKAAEESTAADDITNGVRGEPEEVEAEERMPAEKQALSSERKPLSSSQRIGPESPLTPDPQVASEELLEAVKSEVPLRSVLDLRQPEELLPRLVRTMESLVTEERSEVRIELKPEHLGEMRIRLSMERGIMMAEFVVQDRRVQELLSTQLPQLYAALQEQGTVLGEVMIDIGLGQEKWAAQEQPRDRMPGRGGQPRTETRAVKMATGYSSGSSWHRVDVRV